MCFPAIGAIAGLAGAAVSAAGASMQANAQANQMEYNAKIADINAKTARQQGAYEQDLKEDEVGRAIASGRVAAAKSGLVVGVGSPGVVEAETERNGWLDRMTILWNRETEAVGHENEAQDLRAQAKATRQAGKIGAAAQLIGGLGSLGGGGMGGGYGSSLMTASVPGYVTYGH